MEDRRQALSYRSDMDKVTKSELIKSLYLVDKYVIKSTTDLKGIIISVSQAFCDISGYTKEELLGKSHSIIRHPDMESDIFYNVWKTIKSGKVWSGILKNRAKDGSSYWVQVNIEPNFDNGKIISYTAIREDITSKVKLKELYYELENKIKVETKKNLEQIELHHKEQLKNIKLVSIGSLAAGITHEINTPLTYIKGNFEMMRYDMEDLEPSDIKDRMIEDSIGITDGINRLANIVESMREMAQKSKEVKEDTDVYHTLITALTLICNRSKHISKIKINGKEFTIGLDKNKETFISCVQQQRIEQVWVVILNNALDELVKIENFEDRLINITICYSSDNKNIIVKIKDNAGGISDDAIDTIFEPFTSTKESSGMGVGLNVAKKIIDDQGAKIFAYNEDDGAVFEVHFNCGSC